MIRSTAGRPAAGWTRHSAVAALLVAGILLIAPGLAGAQTDTPDPGDETVTTLEGEGTETTLDGDETVTTLEGDETVTTLEGEGTETESTLEAEPQLPPVEEPAAEFINVEFTPREWDGPCNATPVTVLKNYNGWDDEAYRIRIVVEQDLCDTIPAVAAVYAMAGYGEAWPQTLVETLPVPIKEAGDYLVTFSREIDCVQYDVIVGATPDVIAPLGEWHGPLLFPFDVNTSYQNWDGCPEVAAVTTLPEALPEQLAFTGATSTPVAAFGGVLLLVGAAFLLVTRRRSS